MKEVTSIVNCVLRLIRGRYLSWPYNMIGKYKRFDETMSTRGVETCYREKRRCLWVATSAFCLTYSQTNTIHNPLENSYVNWKETDWYGEKIISILHNYIFHLVCFTSGARIIGSLDLISAVQCMIHFMHYFVQFSVSFLLTFIFFTTVFSSSIFFHSPQAIVKLLANLQIVQ